MPAILRIKLVMRIQMQTKRTAPPKAEMKTIVSGSIIKTNHRARQKPSPKPHGSRARDHKQHKTGTVIARVRVEPGAEQEGKGEPGHEDQPDIEGIETAYEEGFRLLESQPGFFGDPDTDTSP